MKRIYAVKYSFFLSVQGEKAFIALGDKDVECSPNFRMYLATKLSNPVFNPALYAKTNVIDCTVTILVSLFMHSSISASDVYCIYVVTASV
jgi:hypothetical protein